MAFTKAQKTEHIKYAIARAALHKQRWTDTREQVYTALLDYEQPVTAYNLLAAVAETYKRDVSPVSVYRALDALCTIGVAVRVESLNAYLPCQHPEHEHEHILLVCDQCGHTDEMEDSGVAHTLTHQANNKGFVSSRQILELHGTCQDCKD